MQQPIVFYDAAEDLPYRFMSFVTETVEELFRNGLDEAGRFWVVLKSLPKLFNGVGWNLIGDKVRFFQEDSDFS
jgi:hypothetical protein